MCVRCFGTIIWIAEAVHPKGIQKLPAKAVYSILQSYI